jgi:hypothetical protein
MSPKHLTGVPDGECEDGDDRDRPGTIERAKRGMQMRTFGAVRASLDAGDRLSDDRADLIRL